jgi:hypothetical protein
MMMGRSWKAWCSSSTVNEIRIKRNNIKWIFSNKWVPSSIPVKVALKVGLVRVENSVLLLAGWMQSWNRRSAVTRVPRSWSRLSSQMEVRSVSYQENANTSGQT